MADDVQSAPGEMVDLTDDAQVAALQEENAVLRAQLDAQRQEQGRGPLWRRILAGVLAVLAIIAVLAAVQALWLKTTLENEDQFVATFQPLPGNEAVAEALSIRVANGVVEAQGVQAYVGGQLPEELGLLAVPITEAVEQVLAGVAKEVIQSDQVTTVWTVALRGTHTLVSALLSGNDAALEAEDRAVSINLDEVAAVVIERVEAQGLDLPDVDAELGSVVIYQSDELAEAQAVAQAISTIGWFLPLIALLLIAAAIWAAPNRRRMAAILGFGTAVVLLVGLAALRVARNAILGDIESEVSRDAAAAVWDITTSRLRSGTWAVLILAFIVGFIAWLSGPSPRAQRMRSWGGETIDGWRRPAAGETSGFTAFLAEWKRTIQVVIVVLGALFVLFGPTPTGLLVIATAAIVLGLVVLVEVLAGPPRVEPSPVREDAEV